MAGTVALGRLVHAETARLTGAASTEPLAGRAPAGATPARRPLYEEVKCPICRDKNYLVHDVAPGDPRFNQLIPCPHLQSDAEAQREVIRLTYGLEYDLQNVTFENTTWRPELAEAAGRAKQLVEAGCGFLTTLGSTGAGKTWLQAAIVNRARARHLSCLHARTEQLLGVLRAGFDEGSGKRYSERWQQLLDTQVLCIDEAYRFAQTPWSEQRFAELIIARHEARARQLTCLAGNTKLEALPDALRSRIQGPDYFVVIGRDYRRGATG